MARGAAGRLVERWVPGGAVRGRGRLIVLSALAVLVVVALAVVPMLGSPPAAERPPPLPAAKEVVAPKEVAAPSSPPAPGSDPAPESDAPEELVVSMVGRVSEPGLVRLPAGARVADALDAAGGATDGTDLGALNLARRLVDGEQLYVGVPVPEGAQPPPLAVAGAENAPAAKQEQVDLNTATVAQLDELPGVGEVTAQRIVDWRTQHGRFGKVEQLREVDGIGETRFSRLREHVSVQ